MTGKNGYCGMAVSLCAWVTEAAAGVRSLALEASIVPDWGTRTNVQPLRNSRGSRESLAAREDGRRDLDGLRDLDPRDLDGPRDFNDQRDDDNWQETQTTRGYEAIGRVVKRNSPVLHNLKAFCDTRDMNDATVGRAFVMFGQCDRRLVGRILFQSYLDQSADVMSFVQQVVGSEEAFRSSGVKDMMIKRFRLASLIAHKMLRANEDVVPLLRTFITTAKHCVAFTAAVCRRLRRPVPWTELNFNCVGPVWPTVQLLASCAQQQAGDDTTSSDNDSSEADSRGSSRSGSPRR